MLTVLEILAQKIIIGIGSVFVSLGMILMNSPELPLEKVVTEETEVFVESEEHVVTSEEGVSDRTPSTNSSIRSVTPAISKDTEVKKEVNVDFQINNVKFTTNKDANTLNVTWNTTMPSRSRIMFNDTTYESDNGVSQYHEVSISGLSPRISYKYSVSARTQDVNQLEDDSHGFYTLIPNHKVYTVRLGALTEECRELIVTDAHGKTVSGLSVYISASYPLEDGRSSSIASKLIKSTSGGVIKFCEAIAMKDNVTISIRSEEIGDIKLP